MTRSCAVAAALALALATLLGGCTGTGSQEPSNSSSGQSTAPEQVTPTPSPTPIGLGDQVDVRLAEGTLSLIVRSVEVITSCPGRGVPTQRPTFGHFVVLELSAAFEPAAGVEDAYAPVGAEVFAITAPDGILQPVSSTDASWACFENDVLLPPFVDSPEAASGRIVLDSRTAHGTVRYLPSGEQGASWDF